MTSSTNRHIPTSASSALASKPLASPCGCLEAFFLSNCLSQWAKLKRSKATRTSLQTMPWSLGRQKRHENGIQQTLRPVKIMGTNARFDDVGSLIGLKDYSSPWELTQLLFHKTQNPMQPLFSSLCFRVHVLLQCFDRDEGILRPQASRHALLVSS